MAIQFGKTWWGEHWLHSLADVDYDNRLPRGITYARNGSVTSLSINENQITAKVSGRRARPYNVSITVPPFFKKDIAALMDALEQHPALIAGLLNRELHPDILPIAEQCGLKVFPEKWTDLKMQCSCPDWAVPCKHLAAVIYLLSREIDNNPFLVFELRRVDLLEELEKRQIHISRAQVEVPKLTALLPTTRKKRSGDPEPACAPIDLSAIPDVAAALMELLPQEPAFSTAGDIKKRYSLRLNRAIRAARRILAGKLPLTAALDREEGPRLTHRSTAELSIDETGQPGLTGIQLPCPDLESLMLALCRISPDHLPDYQPSVAALHRLFYAALHLLQAGDIIPQIVSCKGRARQTPPVLIRWLPATIEPAAAALVEELDERLQFDLLRLKKVGPKKETFTQLQQQAEPLLSLFLTALVRHLSLGGKKMDAVEAFLFSGTPATFDGVGEKALAGGIKAWFDRYEVASSATWQPQVQIEELAEEQFALSINFCNRLQPQSPPHSLAHILTAEEFSTEKFQILPGLTRLTPFIHGLEGYINDGGTRPLLLDLQAMSPLLLQLLPAIKLLGIQVVLPRSLRTLLRPQLSVQVSADTATPDSISLEKLLHFDWRIAIGDQSLTPQEFNALLDKASGLFRFKERYFVADENELARLQKRLATASAPSRFQLLQTALAEEFEGARATVTPEARELLQRITTVAEVPPPQALQATLRPYQQRGWQWLYHNSTIGFGSLLADDMGLGKTLQVLTLLLQLKEENGGPFLIAVPTGLLANWQAEIARFAPTLTTHLYHGSGRDLAEFEADILLTSYGVVRSDAAKLKKRRWQAFIIDEAQNIKNEKTAQAKAIKSIPATTRIALSGTPVENRLSEFRSIMEFTNRGYLGTAKNFKEQYADPIQFSHDAAAAARFRSITAPFMMRRMKSDKAIISDLPDKVEQNQLALLTGEQTALYEKTMQAAMEEIEGCSPEESLFQRQGLVLQMILALKQICNHPTNFLKNGVLDPALSGKTTLLFELLDAILDSGEKVLVFTQFKEMGTLLQQFLAERYGEAPLFYHGGCSTRKRSEMVERFQHNRADRIFLLSLKAAGTGLNLTAASQVIHYDLWWNPAVESQATDRAYRIGQKQKVTVHRLITKATFEEKIDAMIQQKKALAEMTVATGEKWLGRLSNRELRDIFRQEA